MRMYSVPYCTTAGSPASQLTSGSARSTPAPASTAPTPAASHSAATVWRVAVSSSPAPTACDCCRGAVGEHDEEREPRRQQRRRDGDPGELCGAEVADDRGVDEQVERLGHEVAECRQREAQDVAVMRVAAEDRHRRNVVSAAMAGDDDRNPRAGWRHEWGTLALLWAMVVWVSVTILGTRGSAASYVTVADVVVVAFVLAGGVLATLTIVRGADPDALGAGRGPR